KDAHRLALAEAAIQELPHLRTLAARLPAVTCGAKREHPLLGARAFLVAACPAEGRIEAAGVKGLTQRNSLNHVGINRRRMVERVDVARQAVVVGVHDQIEAKIARRLVAESDHLRKLPSRIDVQKRERWLGRPEGLARKMQQDRRVLPDGVKQHWRAELRCGLTEDVDALRF